MQELLAPDSGPPLGQSRGRVLELLRAAPSPLGVREIAGATGLHPNTARFHLDALVDAGLAAAATRPRGTPGRPSIAYRAVEAGGMAGQRHFRLLAAMLASLVAGVMPDADQAATDAGRAWGRHLTERPAPFQRLDAAAAVGRLVAILEDVGFAPDVPEVPEAVPPAPSGDAAAAEGVPFSLRLRHCPFREVAESNPHVVCGLHLGLMQGALTEMGAPVTADRLEPFVEPSLCVAHLSAGQGPAVTAQRGN